MRGSRRTGFTLVELLVVIVIVGVLAALLLPAITRALCQGRAGSLAGMINQLNQAATLYHTDQGQYPPDDAAFATKPLVDALTASSGKNSSYMEFKKDQLDEAGNIANPVVDGETVKYRNNRRNWPMNKTDNQVHNKQSVDLWAHGCSREDPMEINNW